ncbi:hemerythrin [Spirochaetia bacterium]|nr:hemerythrin [Spirochaetia bacterium]
MTNEDAEDQLIVEWDDKYSVKIPFIDEQHKTLIEHTNTLYQGCLSGTEEEKTAYFMEAVKSVVEYTKFHFSAEEKMLQNVSYPQLAVHKRQHEEFVQKLVDEVKGFQNGEKLVPNNFVRFLRDWILSHIAMEDTQYARYIFGLKKSGTLDNKLHIGG